MTPNNNDLNMFFSHTASMRNNGIFPMERIENFTLNKKILYIYTYVYTNKNNYSNKILNNFQRNPRCFYG